MKRPSNKLKQPKKKAPDEGLPPIKCHQMKFKSAKQKQISFKLYQEDELGWPVDNLLISESHLIRPKNGDLKRICQEQDYCSDVDVVNSAKQKLKRELKLAIEEAINE